MKPILSIALLSAAAALLVSQPAPREQVGPLATGGFLLNSGWRIQAAGHQVPVGTLPMSSALSPDGKFLLVLNGGYNPPSISVLDVESEKEVSALAGRRWMARADVFAEGGQSLRRRRIEGGGF